MEIYVSNIMPARMSKGLDVDIEVSPGNGRVFEESDVDALNRAEMRRPSADLRVLSSVVGNCHGGEAPRLRFLSSAFSMKSGSYVATSDSRLFMLGAGSGLKVVAVVLFCLSYQLRLAPAFFVFLLVLVFDIISKRASCNRYTQGHSYPELAHVL